jgi:hypothetical protein
VVFEFLGDTSYFFQKKTKKKTQKPKMKKKEKRKKKKKSKRELGWPNHLHGPKFF